MQKETEEKLWQEGLLRHIPVVGSLVNFFSPPAKMPIKGRTMNLHSGRIEKSDVTIHAPAQEQKPIIPDDDVPSSNDTIESSKVELLIEVDPLIQPMNPEVNQ